MVETERSSRIRGALLGLLAGDKIGGPSRMALELAESLLARRCFDPQDVITRYKAWNDREGFDTGRVAAMVFRQMDKMSNEEAVREVEACLEGLTAGCNPAHRSLPLALAPHIDTASLSIVGRKEAALTHHHPIAGSTSVAFLIMVRRLIEGSVKSDLDHFTTDFDRELLPGFRAQGAREISSGGYAPDVLHAAIHFAFKSESFSEAMDSSVRFAGPDNYCPVLVGGLAGARWGVESIDDLHLSHCTQQHEDRARELGQRLANAYELQ
jgi:ADP-ribosyl-[dinitrogen reductase] hydrolase